MFYYHEHKDDFKSDTDVNPKDVVSRIAANWRTLSEEDKSVSFLFLLKLYMKNILSYFGDVICSHLKE